MSKFNVSVENPNQKVGFEARIRKNNGSNIITIPIMVAKTNKKVITICLERYCPKIELGFIFSLKICLSF